MGAFLFWLILGTISGAASLVLLLDWFEALRDPDPLAHEGFGLQVLIAVISAPSVAAVSSSRTPTAPWAMIGPESMSGTTKWTLAPWIFTPAASARWWVSRPLKAGSNAG